MICHCDYCQYTLDSAACHLGIPFRKAVLTVGKRISVRTLQLLEKRLRERRLSTDVFEKKSCVKNRKPYEAPEQNK